MNINPIDWAHFFVDRAKSRLSGQLLDEMMRYILERFVMQRPAIPIIENRCWHCPQQVTSVCIK